MHIIDGGDKLKWKSTKHIHGHLLYFRYWKRIHDQYVVMVCLFHSQVTNKAIKGRTRDSESEGTLLGASNGTTTPRGV